MKYFDIDKNYRLAQKGNVHDFDVYKNGEKLPHIPDNRTLFKFYPNNEYSLDCLFRSYFYLSSPENFNDPFDCSTNLIKPNEFSDLNGLQKSLYQDFGVCCLTEQIENLLMWSHYTNYYGFALKFKDFIFPKPTMEDLKLTLHKVIYPEKPRQMEASGLNPIKYAIITKQALWSYEKEWRIICQPKQNNRELKFQADDVQAIYIGYRLHEKKRGMFNLIKEIIQTKYKDAKIFIVKPHKNELKLDFIEHVE
ncbi:MAG: DUF2971 domain-containing protein [Salinivirgaceae bacterium]